LIKKYTLILSQFIFVVLLMGCGNSGSSFTQNMPIEMTKIPNSNFKISTTEVTFDLYDLYTDKNNSPRKNDHNWGRGNRPIIGVSWSEAQEFILWLNKTYSPVKPFRLPTEEEWIEASGNNTTQQLKNIQTPNTFNCNFTCQDKYKNTSPVKSFKVGNYGLYDMLGNAWEWTSTQFNPSKDSLAGNPRSRIQETKYILKGGSWENSKALLSSNSKATYGLNTRHYSFGLRLVQDI